MEPFDIDDSDVTPSAPCPRPISLYYLARPFLAILTSPLHIVSNIFRFIFGILQIPVPKLDYAPLFVGIADDLRGKCTPMRSRYMRSSVQTQP
jgi:hypothetical protein